jgi:hypothetical protein
MKSHNPYGRGLSLQAQNKFIIAWILTAGKAATYADTNEWEVN